MPALVICDSNWKKVSTYIYLRQEPAAKKREEALGKADFLEWKQIISVNKEEPEALKSLYRSPGYKKNQLVLCKNYVLQW
jgi:hypothetical protein